MSKEAFRERLRNAPAEREREKREAEAKAARKKAEELRLQEEARRHKIAEKRAELERLKALNLPMLKKVAREFGLREKAEVFAEELGIPPGQIKEFVEVTEHPWQNIIFCYRVELARRTGREVGYGAKEHGIKTHVFLSPGPKETLTDTLDLYASLNALYFDNNETTRESNIKIGISSKQWKLLVSSFFEGNVYVAESYKSGRYWGGGIETLEDTLIKGFEEIKSAAGRQRATREARKAHQEELRSYYTPREHWGVDGH